MFSCYIYLGLSSKTLEYIYYNPVKSFVISEELFCEILEDHIGSLVHFYIDPFRNDLYLGLLYIHLGMLTTRDIECGFVPSASAEEESEQTSLYLSAVTWRNISGSTWTQLT